MKLQLKSQLLEACETYVEAKLYNVQQVISELEAAPVSYTHLTLPTILRV